MTIPLVFDLDGTLHADDLSWFDYRRALIQRPLLAAAAAPLVLTARGRLKCKIAERSDLDVRTLRYDERVLSYARDQQRAGRTLVLATGSAQSLAERVAHHVGCFHIVIGSTSDRNLISESKALELESRYGRRGFDYAGNSSADLRVWPSARYAIVCNASQRVLNEAMRIANVVHVIPRAQAQGSGRGAVDEGRGND